MKKLSASWLLSLLVLSGCSQHYVMKLNNGLQVTSTSKPKLKGGLYYYKDGLGNEHTVPEGRVREVAPASMAQEENARFRPPPSK